MATRGVAIEEGILEGSKGGNGLRRVRGRGARCDREEGRGKGKEEGGNGLRRVHVRGSAIEMREGGKGRKEGDGEYEELRKRGRKGGVGGIEGKMR